MRKQKNRLTVYRIYIEENLKLDLPYSSANLQLPYTQEYPIHNL